MDRERREIHEEYLVHIAKEFSTNVLATGLLVVEDARRGGLKGGKNEDGFQRIRMYTYKDNNSETSSGEEQVDPRLDLRVLNIKARGDNTSLVEAAIQLDDDFVGTMVINNFKFADIT